MTENHDYYHLLRKYPDIDETSVTLSNKQEEDQNLNELLDDYF